MAQIIPIGQPANDGERQAIAYLRDHLPTDYRVAHNFELRHEDGQWFEIDVAVIAPHAIYVVDVKSTYGEIHVAGSKWHPEGRAPFPSPVAKLRFHARYLHTLLTGRPERRELKAIWVYVADRPPGTARIEGHLGRTDGSADRHRCALGGPVTTGSRLRGHARRLRAILPGRRAAAAPATRPHRSAPGSDP